MTTCPSDETIAALVEGALVEDERGALELHIAGCPACAAIVAELARLVAPDEAAAATATIGRYELAGPLGSGGMGLVLEAFDPLLARRVAVKIVRPDRPLARARLLAEARGLALLADPHILTLHDVVDSERGVCLVTELVDGDPADVWCRRTRPTWPQVQALYLQVARGLVAVHARGLLHRDVKPANVFVGRDGRARLGDFGLVGDGTAALGGTPGFMAPEQAAGAPIDVRADQFGLAMAMIHAVAGTVVPAGTAAAALPRTIPAAAREVLARAIAVRPNDRFDRVADLASALEAPQRRWRLAAAGLGLAAIAAIAVLAWPVAPPVVAEPEVVAPEVAGADESTLLVAWTEAMHENDADRCAVVVTGLVAIDKEKYEGHRAICEMLAGRCKAGVAMLSPAVRAAAASTVFDYCPADGDIPEERADRALGQGKRGRSPAACADRATWVTTLAGTPEDAEKFAMNAIQCFAGIGDCAAAREQAGVLAKLRATTPALELARVAAECDR
ncbi:protein kinase domain-containing protein [Nannocystis bainbridge]|uniref:Protein kinase n=1 Tax=Nannocystis bainbridge TaxID=2995303 RepID=A0ABT5DSN1_9BACT|nr:protein kinase [Nannocystis bainbridge]MDC0716079.1 protein kinase [Nannocystis bainbridge]